MSSEQDREQRILESYRQISLALAREDDLDKMAQVLVHETQNALGVELAMFCRLPAEVLAEAPEGPNEGAGAKALLLPLFEQHASGAHSIHLSELDTEAVRSYLHVPIISASGEVVAALCFGDSKAGRFSDLNLRFIESLAPLATFALERADAARERDLKTRALNAWVALVAHDLRNPLQRICMVTEFLRDFTDEPQQELVAKLKRATDSMQSLITGLLDVVAIEGGSLHLDPIEVDVAQLVQAACRAKKDQAESAGIKLVCEQSDDLPPMTMDGPRIVQALVGLISSAIAATPAGNQVVVSCGSGENSLWIEIRDGAQGVPDEELSHFFDRLHPGTHTRHGATLELSLAHGIIEAHGGAIGAHPGTEGGVTFRLHWPTR